MYWTSRLMKRLRPISRRARRGFTLIEASLTMVIIGVAVAAMMQLLAAGTQSNIASNELTTAINLANNIREASTNLAYTDPTNPTSPNTQAGGSPSTFNDIWDLKGSFTPPLDCSLKPISLYSNWKQTVRVETVSPAQITATRPSDPTVATARITVTVYHNGIYVYQTSWIVCAPDAG
jgi:prepilin-type N-terminal cleavage/methylation domain-containing protein